jgi:hypothetical protein
MIEVITPAGFERFFPELADMVEAGPPSPSDLEALAKRYGVFVYGNVGSGVDGEIPRQLTLRLTRTSSLSRPARRRPRPKRRVGRSTTPGRPRRKPPAPRWLPGVRRGVRVRRACRTSTRTAAPDGFRGAYRISHNLTRFLHPRQPAHTRPNLRGWVACTQLSECAGRLVQRVAPPIAAVSAICGRAVRACRAWLVATCLAVFSRSALRGEGRRVGRSR